MICWLASYPKSGNTWLRVFLANWFRPGTGINELHLAGMNLQAPVDRPGISFVKTHSGNYEVDGVSTIDVSRTHGAIYVVRDPRNVAPSYADHFGISIDEAIEAMNEPGKVLLPPTGPQVLGTWSDHVDSWSGAHRVRYEDLPGAFEGVLRYLGLPVDDRLEQAVEMSSLARLKAQEASEGFKEAKSAEFFGGGRMRLSVAQRRKIEKHHRKVMREFGY